MEAANEYMRGEERAQAEVARLRALIPNPDETTDEILWRDYMRGVHPDILAKQRKVTRERMRLMLRKIEGRRAALLPGARDEKEG